MTTADAEDGTDGDARREALVVGEAVAGNAARAEAQESLLAKASDWSAHVFDPQRADSVTCKAVLVEECLNEVRAVAKSRDEKVPWLKCLPRGIRKSGRLTVRLRRWGERGAKAGEFMVEREAEHENEISTDDEEEEQQ